MKASFIGQVACMALLFLININSAEAQTTVYTGNTRTFNLGTGISTELTIDYVSGAASTWSSGDGVGFGVGTGAASTGLLTNKLGRTVSGVTVSWAKVGAVKFVSVTIQGSASASGPWSSFGSVSVGSGTSSSAYTDLTNSSAIPATVKYIRILGTAGSGGAPSGLYVKTIEIDFTPIITPGGITSGLQQWLNAGTGISSSAGNISEWDDYSSCDYHIYQSTGGKQPDTVNNGLNFNPSVNFVGANNDYLALDATASDITTSATVNSNMLVYMVSKENTRASSSSTIYPFSARTASGTSKFYYTETGANILWDAHTAGTGGRSAAYPYTAGQGNLKTFIHNSVSATKVLSVAVNGKVLSTTGTGVAAAAANTISLGGLATSGTSFDGQIPEFIMYNTQLSAANDLKIQSYLALKYGIHLDQTTATNYVASNWNGTAGTKIWNATAAASGFNNSIFGIGRDSTSGLLQKVSTSANGDALFVMALQNDFTSANAGASRTTGFGRDTSFVMLAHNAAAFTFSNTGILAYDGHNRMARTWQVQKQGIADSVYLGFHKDSLTSIPADCDLYLMASNNNNFVQRENISWYIQLQFNSTTGYYSAKYPPRTSSTLL